MAAFIANGLAERKSISMIVAPPLVASGAAVPFGVYVKLHAMSKP